MKKTNRIFYERADKFFIISIFINSIIVFGLLFLLIILGLIQFLAFLVYDPVLLVYGSFVLGFGYAVLMWRQMIRKYERENGL